MILNQYVKHYLGFMHLLDATLSALSLVKEKTKPVKVMMQKAEYVNLFSSYVNDPAVSEERHISIQHFVCDLYRHKEECTDIVRYKLCSARPGRLETKSLPPLTDSLKLHTARASYHVYVWRKCLENYPEVPSPAGFGWERNEENELVIKWKAILPAPKEVLDLMYCSCSRKCVAGSCPCLDNALHCTDACKKQNCENFPD